MEFGDVEVKSSGKLGRGVFARRDFEPGEIVIRGVVETVVAARGEHTFTIHGVHVVLEGAACLVNHSCDPNTLHVFNETGTFDFVARRPIGVGEQITHDTSAFEYEVEHFSQKCLCGSARCRGEVKGWKDLTRAEREAIRDYAIPFFRHILDVDVVASDSALDIKGDRKS
ncbi:MAG: SET domain-containing methyltransferase [Woeseiaceae bacterium]|nr:SET domain-containing methyltransferase [Woeseiaceae bacterium]